MCKLIQGGKSVDERGKIRFVNGFDMSLIKRFYIIENKNCDIIRGWRGHRIEQRWFFAISGSFEVKVVNVDNWTEPTRNLAIEQYILNSEDQQILNIPKGFATAFKAMCSGSQLLVYSDFDLAHAKDDDYSWDLDYFTNQIVGS